MPADTEGRTGMASMTDDWRGVLLRVAYGALSECDESPECYQIWCGWHMKDDDSPEIRAQRENGASFDWLAVSVPPVSMFDLHAGLVLDGGSLSVGLHAHDRVEGGSAAIRDTATPRLGGELVHRFSPLVAEHQFNFPPSPFDALDLDLWQRRFRQCLELLPQVQRLVHRSVPP